MSICIKNESKSGCRSGCFTGSMADRTRVLLTATVLGSALVLGGCFDKLGLSLIHI